ncbi:MAG: chorismate-binding protein [Ignavibacteriaceae bacterium]|nr:chorismate-binding protein [Ignavibacteriaceae bacterium]
MEKIRFSERFRSLSEIIQQVIDSPFSSFFYTPPSVQNDYSIYAENPFEIRNFKGDLKAFFDDFDHSGTFQTFCLTYELGYFFEKKFNSIIENSSAIKHEAYRSCRMFYKNENVVTLSTSELIHDYPFDSSYLVKNNIFNRNKESFSNDISKIKNYIIEGDTYQVNYTIESSFELEGDISGFILTLMFNQTTRYTAIINLGSELIISISPELFFSIQGRKITVKPMKGTAKRGKDKFSDSKIASKLKMSEKERAENVMIVDLLRNDLGKISKTSTVKVKKLFAIEKYETVFQMVSEIESELDENFDLNEIFKALYPCGSITGAPKIRTMEIINEIEGRTRGFYTGSIGYKNKEKIVLNVAIRTIELSQKSSFCRLGIGSGIVFDGIADSEYEETILKAGFVFNPVKPFFLFETLLFNGQEFIDNIAHIKRLKESAEFFQFNFSSDIILEAQNKFSVNNRLVPKKVKIMLSKSGEISISDSDLPVNPGFISVKIAESRIDKLNPYYFHKTSNRTLYDSIQKEPDIFEYLFFNKEGHLCEGLITNIFILIDKKLHTPLLDCGLLPGIFRQKVIDKFEVNQREISLTELIEAEGVILTNSVRGMIFVAELIYGDKKKLFKKEKLHELGFKEGV